MEPTLFTVFTPIYNRIHTIDRVWNSLKNQTNQNFEWLIVNDGSTDGIESKLAQYKNEADFEVRIFNQQNSGKHIAFNKAIDEAKGQLLVPADSDDSFVPTTLEVFETNWNEYGSENISGIDVLCMDEEKQTIGDHFPIEGVSNRIDVYHKHKIKGEKWGCIRVDVLRKYKFPEMYGANFFPESYIWLQIGINYDTIYLNIPLRMYYQDAGNQLMKVKDKSIGTLKIENYYSIWWVNTVLPVVKKYVSKRSVLKRFAGIWKSTFLIKKSPITIIKEFKKPTDKLFAILTFLPAVLVYKVLKAKK